MTAFKTTHVGSLPRPREMMTTLLRKQDVTQADLKHYVKTIVEKQMSIGIDIINNGELPRADYVQSTISRITGFDGTAVAPIPKDLQELPEFSRRFGGRNALITLNPKAPVMLPACSGPLAYAGATSLRQELDMMAGAMDAMKADFPGVEPGVFFTSPSPGTIALFMANQFYPDYPAYLDAIGQALKQEYDIIASYGFHLQIDCPDLAMGRHTGFKHLSDDDFVRLIDTHVKVLNQALGSIDPGKCRAHVCWGNYAGSHHCDIGIAAIIESIMNINARFISIEASNHRHAHEWTVFETFKLPEDKVLMPGVIDTSSNVVEHPDLVAQRIVRFADLLGTDRVIPSTDCGFATTASAASVSGDIAWRKLAALVEGARRASRKMKLTRN